MEYRAVKNRCAIDISALALPISYQETITLLMNKGFGIVDVDLIELARQCIGISCYQRGVNPCEAPAVVDCSSFVKWLYGQRGIWLPRLAIQQRAYGEAIEPYEIRKGDLVFTSIGRNSYLDTLAEGVGHVGIATDASTMVHATKRIGGVREDPLEQYIDPRKFRGARRLILLTESVLTLQIPDETFIETTDDLRWLILHSLPFSKDYQL